jgi:glycosyltransferase involved in cell wall biosynthesis
VRALRILVVVHQFLPADSAGTEVYAYTLAKALRLRGHELFLYYTTRDPARPQYALRRGTYDGLPFHEVVHNHAFPDFRSVYKDAAMEAHLRTVLDETRPDVVHVQHLHLHSIGYLGICKQRGLPIVFTLAEYLLICLRSWLVTPDFTLCAGPAPEKCARCASRVSPPVRPLGVRAGQRYSLRRFLDKLRRRLRPSSMIPAVELRRREIEAELGCVDVFVAPSRVLAERFVATGMVARERIACSDYGFDPAPFAACLPRDRGDGTLRVGFIGSIAEQKGVHLLVEAFNELPEQGVECRIHGGLTGFPEYVDEVRARRAHVGVRFLGRYDNTKIAEVLRGLDVLVIPSRWFENSPLTIHEAFMAGVPVITGDRGGMAELVEHERSGLHFKVGDASDLRRQIERLMKEPELLERIRAGIPRVKAIAEDAREMEERFRAVIQQSAGAR